MDVADEAPALDPEPVAAPAEPVAEAPAAPVVEAPAAIPIDPPAAPTTEVEDAALALTFRPTPFRALLVRSFWAGLLGAGVCMWAAGTIQAFGRAYLIARPGPSTGLFLPLLLALGVAFTLGYRERIQSYAAIVGRVLGSLLFGGVSGALITVILALIFDGLHVRNQAAFVTIALAGALFAGLALARIYGITADRSRRIKIAGAASVALLVTIWPVAPSLRCRLGFGEGCREASDREEDRRSAAWLAERGCEHEDTVSCRIAAQVYRSEGPLRDVRRAEGFYREGCALGDPESCDGVHELELEQRCDRYGAFACAELARAHARGEGMTRDRALAQRYYRKACLLGAEDACREAEGR